MKRNWTHLTATLIVAAFAAGALAISFAHIIELAHRYGVEGWQALAAPFFVDGFMLLGRLGISTRLDAATNRIGRRMMTAGALLSFAANIAVGETIGQRVFGALIVAGFLAAEWYAGKLRPAEPAETTEERTARERAEKRSAAAKKAAATRAANKAAAKPRAPRKPRTPKVPANAPVSPAPGGRMVGGLWVAATLSEALAS